MKNDPDLKKKFFQYLKTDRVNDDILKAKDEDTGRVITLSITSDGELYDKKGMHIGKAKQKKFLQKLFDLALEDNFNIVPVGFLSGVFVTEYQTT